MIRLLKISDFVTKMSSNKEFSTINTYLCQITLNLYFLLVVNISLVVNIVFSFFFWPADYHLHINRPASTIIYMCEGRNIYLKAEG